MRVCTGGPLPHCPTAAAPPLHHAWQLLQSRTGTVATVWRSCVPVRKQPCAEAVATSSSAAGGGGQKDLSPNARCSGAVTAHHTLG